MTERDTPTRWVDRAACVGAATSDFYASKPGPALNRAKACCAGCPVTAECVAAAILEERGVEDQTLGYRGGLTANARLRLARQRLRVVAA